MESARMLDQILVSLGLQIGMKQYENDQYGVHFHKGYTCRNFKLCTDKCENMLSL